MIILIYLIGFIVCYYSIRYVMRKTYEWNWIIIIFSMFFSLLSWISLIIYLFILLCNKIYKNIDFYKKDPPKWL